MQEHAANTAVGLKFADNTTYMYLVTANGGNSSLPVVFCLTCCIGYDGGTLWEPTSGILAGQFAHFMLDYLNVDQAMGMPVVRAKAHDSKSCFRHGPRRLNHHVDPRVWLARITVEA